MFGASNPGTHQSSRPSNASSHAASSEAARVRQSSTASMMVHRLRQSQRMNSWQGDDDFLATHEARPAVHGEQRSSRRRATMQRAASLEHSAGSPAPIAASEIWSGRPDLAEMLEDVAAEAAALGETRVALMACGAGGVVSKLRELAARGGFAVRFDVHHEVFGFG